MPNTNAHMHMEMNGNMEGWVDGMESKSGNFGVHFE